MAPVLWRVFRVRRFDMRIGLMPPAHCRQLRRRSDSSPKTAFSFRPENSLSGFLHQQVRAPLVPQPGIRLRVGSVAERLFRGCTAATEHGPGWVGMMFPLVSRSSIVPVTTYGPFGLASIVTSAISNPPYGAISLSRFRRLSGF